MAKIGILGKSKKPKNKNVLITRAPKNSSGSKHSNNSRSFRSSSNSQNSREYRNFNSSRNSRNHGNLNSSRNSRNHRKFNSYQNSRGSGNSIWSKNYSPKKPRSPKQMLFMAIILIAFICGLALGISMIMGIGQPDPSDSSQVQYMNVTNNITKYENSSYDLLDENGTEISYYDFDENISEGQDIRAFNASSSAHIY